MPQESPSAAGFSLTELLVAMLVTMLVSGAVFGLLTAGQGAFRREPELTDRQQNIRLAMDLVQRDLAVAGQGIGPFDQVFIPGLNGFNPPSGAPSGQQVDALSVVGATGECPEVRGLSLTDPTTVNTTFPLPACFGTAGPVAGTMANGTTLWGFARGMNPDGTGVIINFTGVQPAGTTLALGFASVPVSLLRMQWVRYEVAPDPNDLGVPALWRSESGGFDPVTGAAVVVGTAPVWQLVARGIEDLQVRYRPSSLALANTPPAVAVNTWNTLTQEVEVTLWARAIAQNLQGQRTDGGATAAVRGALTTVTTPRAVLLTLRTAPMPFTWK